jgi:ADP-ribose pyrophosphatase
MPLGTEPAEILHPLFFYQARKFAFHGNRIRLPNGAEGDFTHVQHPGGAMVVPMTPDGRLILLRQYRFAVRGRLLEFPAGTLEVGETPFTTIQREIEEETGHQASQWQDLGEFFLAPGYSDEIIYVFLALGATPIAHQPAGDEDEDIEVLFMTPAEFEGAIAAGEPIDAKTLAAYLKAKPHIGFAGLNKP